MLVSELDVMASTPLTANVMHTGAAGGGMAPLPPLPDGGCSPLPRGQHLTARPQVPGRLPGVGRCTPARPAQQASGRFLVACSARRGFAMCGACLSSVAKMPEADLWDL